MIIPMLAPALTFETAADEELTWADQTATAFAGGTGTASDPYQIATGAQLAYLAKMINSTSTWANYATKSYKLTADIDLKNIEWIPIAGVSYAAVDGVQLRFKGTFDGNGHTIYNMYIGEDQPLGAALFGITHTATVKNFTLKGKITASALKNSTNSVPGSAMLMVAAYDTDISGVNIYADIEVDHRYNANAIGGMVNYICLGSTVTDCNVYGTIVHKNGQSVAALDIGGVAAKVRNTSFVNVNCDVDIFVIDLPAQKITVGGLLGYTYSNSALSNGVVKASLLDPTVLRGCGYTGDISVHGIGGSERYFGGLIGRVGTPAETDYTQGGKLEITSCYYEGGITADFIKDTGTIYEGLITAIMTPFEATVSGFMSTDDDVLYNTLDEVYAYGSGNSALTVTDKKNHVLGISVDTEFGVAVRLSPGSSGLRFNSKIDVDLYDALMARTDLTVQLGTYIAPTDYVTAAGGFHPERLEEYVTKQGYSNAFLNVKFDPEVNEWLDAYYDDESVHYFSGAIANIQTQNHNRPFSGIGYIEITMNGYSHAFCAEYADAGRSRTVAYVAKKAIEDRSDVQINEYQYLTEDGDYSPYTTKQLENIADYANAYNANAMNTADLTLVSGGVSQYSIVYPYASTGAEREVAAYLQQLIYNRTGVKLAVHQNTPNQTLSGYEIVVGCKDRAEAYVSNLNAMIDEYSVFTSGKRVIILGDNADALVSAVHAFAKEALGFDPATTKTITKTTNAITLSRFINLKKSVDGDSTALNNSLSGYSICYTEATADSNVSAYMRKRMAYSLQQAILAATGVELALVDSSVSTPAKRIVLTDKASLTEGTFSVSTSGTVITIAAGSYYGFEGAEDYLVAELLYGMSPVTTTGFSVKGDYAAWVDDGFEEATQYAYNQQGNTRIMFYNVLFNESASGGSGDTAVTYNVPTAERNALQAQMIAQYRPDVLACQEFNKTKRGSASDGKGGLVALLNDLGYAETVDPWVDNAYPTDETIPGTDASLTNDYTGEIKGYGTSGATEKGYLIWKEYTFFNNTPLFYNTETTNYITGAYYWYKNQWDQRTGSTHSNSASDCGSKSATWGLFEDIATGDRYIVIGTHMCTRSDYVRGLQAAELNTLIAELTESYHLPIFLGGDFNGNSDDSNYKAFIEAGYRDLVTSKDASVFSSEVGSTHGYPDNQGTWGGLLQPVSNYSRNNTSYTTDNIDRIFGTNDESVDYKVYAYVVDECTLSGSDHLAFFTDIVFKNMDDSSDLWLPTQPDRDWDDYLAMIG